MKTYNIIGVQVPQILLPHPGIDLAKWAVIACDQFTSQPEYWEEVENIVGDAPSTLNLFLPEIYLDEPDADERIYRIYTNMRTYLDQGIFELYEGMLYVERTVGHRTRKGLIAALDLECYDYNKGSHTLTRATEGAIVERFPPRVRIRQGALLESPHVLMLVDDPEHTVIEPIGQMKHKLPRCYDFDLMLDSGHLTGYLVNDPSLRLKAIQALRRLADPQAFARRYNVDPERGVMLFAVGDGNHSLAAAKVHWENLKSRSGGALALNHPARYALVEIVNVHDESLIFGPINRLVFGIRENILTAMQHYFGDGYSCSPCHNAAEMVSRVDIPCNSNQVMGIVTAEGYSLIEISKPSHLLTIGSLQNFLDQFRKENGAAKIDYVHGTDVVCKLGNQAGNAGFYLPTLPKNDLFKTVIQEGVLPRKTFAMTEAREKRFYLECRQIA